MGAASCGVPTIVASGGPMLTGRFRGRPPGRPTGLRLLLFSRSGFTTNLRETAAATDDVELIDLERLCTGS